MPATQSANAPGLEPCYYHRAMHALARALVGIALLVALPSPAAHGAPTLEVRARTQIFIDSVKRSGDYVQVRGKVVDIYSQEPVPGARVTVRMNNLSESVTTDGNGELTAWFEIDDGRHDVSVEFPGQGNYENSEAAMSGVDVSKLTLELRISASDVSYSNRTIEVVVRASTEYGGEAITAEIFAGGVSGEMTRVGSVTTDSNGRGTANIERSALGKPGRKRLRARFLGDRTFNPADAQTEFLFATATKVSLELDAATIAYEDELGATGHVMDDLGNPVAGGPVTLLAGTRRVAATLTDSDGGFLVSADGDEIGPGKLNVQAVFEPSEPWYQPSRSEPAQIEVAEPQPVPVTHTLAAFGATALAMAAFLGLRSKPWEAWLAKLASRRQRDAGDDPADPAEPKPRRKRGLQPARPSLVSTFRRPNAYDFTGTVRDSVKGRPIPGSAISITHSVADERESTSDREGRFAFDELEPGEWTAVCAAHGYITEKFAVTVPHRGELRDVHIDMLPVRERIFSMYRDVAEPLLPDSDLWGVWTPRQIFDYVREEKPATALSDLTNFVEETYFSQRAPTEALLPDAEGRVERARIELAPRARPQL